MIIRNWIEADTEEDVCVFAGLIKAIPGVKAGMVFVKENGGDEGFRGYLRVISEPAPDMSQFRISSTTVDGRGRSILVCIPCAYYGYNISSRGICSRVGGLFDSLGFPAIIALAATHQCPGAVTEYMKSKGNES